MRGTIVVDANRCKGCELCTFVCPKHVISMADHFTSRGYRPAQLVDADGLCTGCLLCATICPDVAISVYRTASGRQQPVVSPQVAGAGPQPAAVRPQRVAADSPKGLA
jgi:2-oxoglutarate ferredoxin oxidoreductase subunit delta